MGHKEKLGTKVTQETHRTHGIKGDRGDRGEHNGHKGTHGIKGDTGDTREHRGHTPTKVKSQSIPLKCFLALRKFVIKCINKNRSFDFAFQVD